MLWGKQPGSSESISLKHNFRWGDKMAEESNNNQQFCSRSMGTDLQPIKN